MFYYIDRPIHGVSYLERFAKAFTQRQINTVSTHLEAHVNVHNALQLLSPMPVKPLITLQSWVNLDPIETVSILPCHGGRC